MARDRGAVAQRAVSPARRPAGACRLDLTAISAKVGTNVLAVADRMRGMECLIGDNFSGVADLNAPVRNPAASAEEISAAVNHLLEPLRVIDALSHVNGL